MLKRHCLAAALAMMPLAAGATETLHISGAGSERDIACEAGQDVSVSGMRHKLVLTGPCGAIEIHGSGHLVSFDTAQSLHVSGIGNTATGQSVAKLSVDVTENKVETMVKAADGPAEIEVSGADQALDLSLGGPAKLSVNGTRNRVAWKAGPDVKPPAVSLSGIENKVIRR